MKNLLFVLLVLSFSFAEHFIYVGQDNDGKLMAGVVNRIYPQYPLLTSYIESDIRSTGMTQVTNTEGRQGFKPEAVTYYLKLSYNGFYLKHSCKHILDDINTSPENIDIIGFEMKY